MRNNIGKYAATVAWPVLVTALILLAWEISVRALGVRSIILPPPSAVLETMAERHDLLLTHLWPSLYLTVLGFLLSVIGGIFVAVLITYSAIVRKGFYPVIVVSPVFSGLPAESQKSPSRPCSSCGSGPELCRACCWPSSSRSFR